MTVLFDLEVDTPWAAGDYLTVAGELFADLGPRLVEAAGLRAGDRVLDIAAGTGNAAIPAALAGAAVVACDLSPRLLALGRVDAAIRGADLDWDVADAGRLPYADASFDAALSCLGVLDAGEMLRIVRPGGRIALLSWTPDSVGGRLDPAVARWGDRGYVEELLGDDVTDLTVRRETLYVRRFTSGTQFADYLRTFYGPVVAGRCPVDDLAGLAEGAGVAYGIMGWDYLLVTARRT